MAASIRDFQRKKKEKEALNKEAPEPDPAQRAAVNEIAAQYEGRSEDELMRELLRVTGEQKRDGSFDAAGMRRTAASIMPMLTPEQAEKLMKIMEMLG